MATTKKIARSKSQGKRGSDSAVDEKPPHHVSIRGAIQSLRLGCDQLGQAIAGARQAEDFDTVDNLTPVLASIWSARMELGDGPEVQP